MILRKLGSTSLLVSPLGLGLAALGRPAYINLGHANDLNQNYDVSAMEHRCHRILDLALSQGINYFDAARSYGKAEYFLGNWLEKEGFEEKIIGSKWGYTYTADWQIDAENHEIKDHSLQVLQKQWNESNTSLKLKPHLYQIHSATLESGVLTNTDVLNELAKLKSEGTYIGITVSGEKQPEILERALSIMVDGIRLFDTIQATWNLLETSSSLVLHEARKDGVGIIVKEGVANGRLTHRNNEKDFNWKMEMLQKIALENNTSVDAVALAVIMHQPWADIVLSGAATEEHLLSNLKANQVTFLEGQLEELFSIFPESAATYWTKRKQLAWN
jgi:aryl-alcohol dehydrogenase-like predicted oxidoreductase